MTISMVIETGICLVMKWVVEKDLGREDPRAISSQNAMGAPTVLIMEILHVPRSIRAKTIYQCDYDVRSISKSENLLKGRDIY